MAIEQWYGLVDPADGDLVSVGTVEMFPDKNMHAFDGVYEVVNFGTSQPNWEQKLWSKATKKIIDRPPPVLISRLDDYEQWLLADPDFQQVWGSLNAARKAQVRLGMRRVLGRMLGGQVNRQESELPEL